MNKKLRQKYDFLTKSDPMREPFIDKDFTSVEQECYYLSPDPLLPIFPSRDNKEAKVIIE